MKKKIKIEIEYTVQWDSEEDKICVKHNLRDMKERDASIPCQVWGSGYGLKRGKVKIPTI